MRKSTASFAVLMALASAAPAFAQTNAATNPAAPSSSQSMPQPVNSVPPGAGTQSESTLNGSAANNKGTSNTGMTTQSRSSMSSGTAQPK